MDHTCTDPDVGAMLHAFELGALADGDRERFEIHLLACDACARHVQEFEREAALLREDPAVISAVQEGVGPDRTIGFWESLRAFLWPQGPVWSKPAVLYLVILLLIYPAWTGLREHEGESVRPVQSLTLIPTRSVVPVTASSRADRDLALTFIYEDARMGETYRLTLVRAESDTVYEASASTFDRYQAGHILVPHERVLPGAWTLTIEPVGSQTSSRRQHYEFEVLP